MEKLKTKIVEDNRLIKQSDENLSEKISSAVSRLISDNQEKLNSAAEQHNQFLHETTNHNQYAKILKKKLKKDSKIATLQACEQVTTMIDTLNTKWASLKSKAEDDLKNIKGYDQILALAKSEADKILQSSLKVEVEEAKLPPFALNKE